MTTIQFKAKIETISIIEGGKVLRDIPTVKVPQIKRRHCDMHEFRKHAKYGTYANSDFFEKMINADIKKEFGEYIRVDQERAGVTIEPGFLASVTLAIA